MAHDYSQQMDDDPAVKALIESMNKRADDIHAKRNSPTRFAPEPERNFKLWPALCLDLDDTVRYSANGKFINKAEDVRLFPDVEAKLWEYRDNHFLIFGVSNQGGVAHGFKTSRGVDQEIEATFMLFKRNPFHIVKCCLHEADGKVEPYNHRSLLRKPDYGMLALCEVEAFQAGYIVDWDKSLFVGDRSEDRDIADKAGIKFIPAEVFFGRGMPQCHHEDR
jgi:D-glycero-D-manno-heptose 1,7-bisphosphate phosphatase